MTTLASEEPGVMLYEIEQLYDEHIDGLNSTGGAA
jgi:hypothetical protein